MYRHIYLLNRLCLPIAGKTFTEKQYQTHEFFICTEAGLKPESLRLKTCVLQWFTFFARETLQIPLCGWICRVEGVLQFYWLSMFFFQLTLVLHVMLHQFCQRCKLLSTIQVIEISCVLNLNVSYLPWPPDNNQETHDTHIKPLLADLGWHGTTEL